MSLRSILASLLVVVVVTAMLAGSTSAASCQCSCCNGANCTVAAIGVTSSSSCSSCTENLCRKVYAQCPVSGGALATCLTSNKATSHIQPSACTSWSGDYQVNSYCEPGECGYCYKNTIKITRSGLRIFFSGEAQVVFVNETTGLPYVDTVQIDGGFFLETCQGNQGVVGYDKEQSFWSIGRLIKTSSNTIRMELPDDRPPVCPFTATCTGDACSDSFSSASSVAVSLVVLLVATVFAIVF